MSLFFLSICRSQYPVEFATWIHFGSTWIHKKIHRFRLQSFRFAP